jgi:hypothetical protein
MAQPTTVRPSKMRILLESTDSPGVFEAPCGLTNKNITINKSFTEVNIPDCDDPDAPFWLARDVESMSMEISFEGVLSYEYEAEWDAANFSMEAVAVRVEIEFDAGTRVLAGDFHVTVSIGGQGRERVQVSGTMQSDGIITSTWDPAE